MRIINHSHLHNDTRLKVKKLMNNLNEATILKREVLRRRCFDSTHPYNCKRNAIRLQTDTISSAACICNVDKDTSSSFTSDSTKSNILKAEGRFIGFITGLIRSGMKIHRFFASWVIIILVQTVSERVAANCAAKEMTF